MAVHRLPGSRPRQPLPRGLLCRCRRRYRRPSRLRRTRRRHGADLRSARSRRDWVRSREDWVRSRLRGRSRWLEMWTRPLHSLCHSRNSLHCRRRAQPLSTRLNCRPSRRPSRLRGRHRAQLRSSPRQSRLIRDLPPAPPRALPHVRPHVPAHRNSLALRLVLRLELELTSDSSPYPAHPTCRPHRRCRPCNSHHSRSQGLTRQAPRPPPRQLHHRRRRLRVFRPQRR